MGSRFELVAFTIGLALTFAVLALEWSEPVTAAGFMWTLHKVEWIVVALMAPYVLAGGITLFGSVVATRAFVTEGRPDWRWMAAALFLAPALGWAGHFVVGGVIIS